MLKRISAILTLVGGLIFAAATIFHPPLTNPWDVSYAFKEVNAHEHWILDHWFFLSGLTLWLIGLAQLADGEQNRSRNAARLFIGSLTLWYIILAAELAVLPQLLSTILIEGKTYYQPIWNALFTWGLFAGYLAMFFVYIGIILLAINDQGVLRMLGIITGGIALMATLLLFAHPNLSIYLAMPSLLPFLWTLWFAIKRMVNPHPLK
ncbi:hypothetical protein JOD43_001216 [Pullulanibacillus pueri]|uniref:DUF4386 family protein n=1 Tax=Pullulanibacillus pueri TaxID=1437324 RepID=A0A8J3ELL3_9BACL|nr:hypothetical protein [Pullulanibacillus pueri]MBM7681049.1 hypothetical protein [Pullulanibacillus pueri]GGH76841.1 hypothetical protein GCM10007096_07850 [Pullulanibacillus pueri]